MLLAISTDEWTAIGSIATATTVLIGLASFLYERRRAQHEEAAQVRQQAQAFATAAHRTVEILKEGTPLISAAWHTARALSNQAGERPTADSVRALIGDSSAALTAAVEGWGSASAGDELRAAFADLVAAGRGLSGQLSIFWSIAVLLRRMSDDGYSNVIFIKLLTDEPASQFLSGHQDEDLEGLVRALAEHLHGNAAGYFAVRYEPGLVEIQAFIDTAATAFAEMGPRALLRAAQAAVPVKSDATYTEELRDRVAGLAVLLPEATALRLGQQIARLERSISTDAATERLKDEPNG